MIPAKMRAMETRGNYKNETEPRTKPRTEHRVFSRSRTFWDLSDVSLAFSPPFRASSHHDIGVQTTLELKVSNEDKRMFCSSRNPLITAILELHIFGAHEIEQLQPEWNLAERIYSSVRNQNSRCAIHDISWAIPPF
jgi:hypothetical protein